MKKILVLVLALMLIMPSAFAVNTIIRATVTDIVLSGNPCGCVAFTSSSPGGTFGGTTTSPVSPIWKWGTTTVATTPAIYKGQEISFVVSSTTQSPFTVTVAKTAGCYPSFDSTGACTGTKSTTDLGSASPVLTWASVGASS